MLELVDTTACSPCRPKCDDDASRTVPLGAYCTEVLGTDVAATQGTYSYQGLSSTGHPYWYSGSHYLHDIFNGGSSYWFIASSYSADATGLM